MKHFLTVIVPEKKAVKYALKGETITIGRAGNSAIALDVSAVSSNHLEIRKTDTGYQIVDLGSTNGTTVNGDRITAHDLADGDDLVIGTAVRAQYAAVADEATAAATPAQPLRPKVAVPASQPASPTVVLKKAPVPAAPAAQSPSQPVDPPTDIRPRKMTPPGEKAPVDDPAPPPAQQDSSQPEPEASPEQEAQPEGTKLNVPNTGQSGGGPKKLNLG